jgi:hypothetical protein
VLTDHWLNAQAALQEDQMMDTPVSNAQLDKLKTHPT